MKKAVIDIALVIDDFLFRDVSVRLRSKHLDARLGDGDDAADYAGVLDEGDVSLVVSQDYEQQKEYLGRGLK